MATLFTRIIHGEIPGRFVWRDEHCVSFLTIRPLRHGHVLVVPRQEIDHWLDLPADLAAHLMTAAQSIGKALQRAYKPVKVGMMIVGLEVPHVHLHLVPLEKLQDINFANPPLAPGDGELDRDAETIRSALKALGHSQAADR